MSQLCNAKNYIIIIITDVHITIILSPSDMRSCINQEKCFVLLPWLVWAGLNTVMVIAAAVLVVFIEVLPNTLVCFQIPVMVLSPTLF